MTARDPLELYQFFKRAAAYLTNDEWWPWKPNIAVRKTPLVRAPTRWPKIRAPTAAATVRRIRRRPPPTPASNPNPPSTKSPCSAASTPTSARKSPATAYPPAKTPSPRPSSSTAKRRRSTSAARRCTFASSRSPPIRPVRSCWMERTCRTSRPRYRRTAVINSTRNCISRRYRTSTIFRSVRSSFRPDCRSRCTSCTTALPTSTWAPATTWWACTTRSSCARCSRCSNTTITWDAIAGGGWAATSWSRTVRRTCSRRRLTPVRITAPGRTVRAARWIRAGTINSAVARRLPKVYLVDLLVP